MCGITGYFKSPDLSIGVGALIKATNEIVHRGPDSFGYYEDEYVGLGHRRLSIIDLTPSGYQPMFSSSGRFVISFNGEIYNFLEIKEKLQSLGYIFKGNSDTEVLINGFDYWGVKVFKRLNGIFAISIFDLVEKKLYLVRDRLGVKPLYYLNDKGKWLFGSEIKCILSHDDVSRKLSPQGFREFLYYGYALGTNTMFKNVYKLEPGSFAIIDTKGILIEKYWKIEDVDLMQPPDINEKNIIHQTKIKLEEAIRRQLISDVPVGVFLSGGIDSSAITAFASKQYSSQLKTYSAAFDFDNGHSELPLAAKVAKMFGTDHHEMMIYGKDLKDVICTLISHHDEPFSDAANIPLYLLTKEVKSDCKVILQGDGGDELFAGYPGYHLMKKFAFYKFLFSVSHFLSPILPSKFLRQKTERFYPLFFEKSESKFFASFLTTESSIKNTPESILSSKMQEMIKNTSPYIRYDEILPRFKFLPDNVQKLLWIDMSKFCLSNSWKRFQKHNQFQVKNQC